VILIAHILDTLAIIAIFDAQNLDDRSTVHFVPLKGLCLFLPYKHIVNVVGQIYADIGLVSAIH
jgi:hypothetical protein